MRLEDRSSAQCRRMGLPLGRLLAMYDIRYINADIPVVILFRALGCVSDREVIERIVYDFSDTQMMFLLRPSIEEAMPIMSQEVIVMIMMMLVAVGYDAWWQVALDFIAKRGPTIGTSKSGRIQ